MHRLLPLLLLALAGCSTAPPHNLDDSCAIFREKDDWYDAAKDAYQRWGVPPQIQLAIIYQESRFQYDAKTPRGTLLWVIPWFRKSSAYGYAQVKDETWDWYRRATGNSGADRDDFDDAVDFIAWYGSVSHQKLGISRWDAYKLYLAYHEGIGGYRQRTYLKKPWLIKIARRVKARAGRYGAQLRRCRKELESWHFWPF